jgi:hypothetical protein
MTKKHETATRQVLDHVDRARGALDDFHHDGINAKGVLASPLFQVASLKVARD